MVQNLHSFIKREKRWADSDISDEVDKYETISRNINDALFETLIVECRNNNENNIEELKRSIEYGSSYTDFVNNIIRFLIINKVNNALKVGYVDHTRTTSYANDFFNPSVGLQTNALKSPVWSSIYKVIGKDLFLKLLLVHSVYIPFKGKYRQLCGPVRTLAFNKDDDDAVNHVMTTNVFPMTYSETVEEILSMGQSELDRYADMKGCKKVIRQCFARHVSFRYSLHYRRLKTETISQSSSSNWLQKEDSSIVVSYCLFVTKRIFSLVVWGSEYNRKLIQDWIVEFVTKGKKSLPPPKKLAEKFRISKVSWLGASTKIVDQGDLKGRKQVLSVFLAWYFHCFLARLLAKFWKIVPKVETGGKQYMEYYPKSEWYEYSDKWISEYIESYLYKSSDEFTKLASQESSFVGRVKLLPKKNDFRMLCAPLKSRPLSSDKDGNQEAARYGLYVKKVIKPLQHLLIFKDREFAAKSGSHHPRAYSQQDIANNISHFRLKLKETRHRGPLFVLKFDMKHCYDNMDQDLLLRSVEGLFDDDGPDKAFYVNSYTSKSMIRSDKDKKTFFIRDSDNFGEFLEEYREQGSKNPNKTILDQGITKKFYKRDVIDLVKSYVLDSAIFINGNSSELYKRKKGVFQGFPLSATLCNIYFNQLVDRQLRFLHSKEHGHSSILLRLVDDFLYISTVDDRQQLFSVLNGESFSKYGAILNEGKTVWYPPEESDPIATKSLSNFVFVGLDIDMHLRIKPSCIYDPTRLALEKCENLDDVFSLLGWWFKTQLKPYMINIVFGESIAYLNMKRVWSVLLDGLESILAHLNTGGHVISTNRLSIFVAELLELSVLQWHRTNRQHDNSGLVEMLKTLVTQKSFSSERLRCLYSVVHNI